MSRLEELKGVLESWGAWSDWNESQRKVLKDLACLLERVRELESEINTHEPHGRSYTNEQHVQLRERVQELEEENKQIKTTYQDRVDDIESMREMLGLTWEHFQDETGQPIEKLQGDEINRLQEDNQRYKHALEEIAQDTGTPYADIAIRALAGNNS